jgi:predicted transcriptional regulator
MAVVTVRLEAKLDKELSRISKQLRKTRSDIVREALERRLAVLAFEDARRRLMPKAEAAGYLTDEDVLRDIS